MNSMRGIAGLLIGLALAPTARAAGSGARTTTIRVAPVAECDVLSVTMGDPAIGGDQTLIGHSWQSTPLTLLIGDESPAAAYATVDTAHAQQEVQTAALAARDAADPPPAVPGPGGAGAAPSNVLYISMPAAETLAGPFATARLDPAHALFVEGGPPQSIGSHLAAARFISRGADAGVLYDASAPLGKGDEFFLTQTVYAGEEPSPPARVPWEWIPEEFHDINNLLTAVGGNAELLRYSLRSDAGAAGLLGEVSAAVERMVGIMGGARKAVPRGTQHVELGFVVKLASALRAEADLIFRLVERLQAGGNPALGLADNQQSLSVAVAAAEELRDRVERLDRRAGENGELHIEIGRLRPASTAEKALRLFRRKAAKQGITLALELEPDLPEVLGDPRLVEHILENLLSNGVKFTAFKAGERPSGFAGRVVLRARREGGEVVFTVEDNGPGIAAEDLGRIFQKGAQSGPQAYREAGSGLGLDIAKHYAQLQETDITVESVLGQGTTFIFRLRIAAP